MPSIKPFFVLIFIISFQSFSQQTNLQKRKTYTAVKFEEAPKIDGILEEDVWRQAPVATDFVMVEPGDGEPAPASHETNVKIGYTNEAIYIAAYLFDDSPASIRREFAQRDNIPVADAFIIDFNTYDDGENQTRFIITAAGTIADAKIKGQSEDINYDVVWEGQVSIDEDGWYAEIMIPYSALRFPEKDEQVWGLQMGREIRSRNETYVWSYVDKSIGISTHYNGLLKGITNINPPVRLSFYPYVSGEIDQYEGETNSAFSAGMDFKYGLTDAFTLDATLVPDFGQTAYDEVELNLGPFEQAFDENRAFFTEGTELFTKGDLFYSRRIGDTPTGFNDVQDQKLESEEIISNPDQTNLLNALKISGRTKSGLGVGIFNAFTEVTKAELENIETGELRQIITEPFTNYNIFVLDQQYNQKSSISLINTNVIREGNFRDGNVSAFLFDIFNNSSSYNFSGEAKMSRVNLPNKNKTGFASTLSFERSKGNFRYGVRHRFANETYDINDLGLNFVNNYNNFFWETSYRTFKPTGIFNQYRVRLYGNHQRRYQPDVTVGSGIGSSFFGVTRNRFAFGGSLDANTSFKDYFEPRKQGSYILYPESGNISAWVSSDYRKRFAYDIRLRYGKFFESSNNEHRVRLRPRFRFSNRFLVAYSINYVKENNRNSFVNLLPQDIIFGTRDIESVENSVQGSYNFSTREAVSLSFRNFWSSASFDSKGFSRLLSSGNLASFDYEVNEDNDPDANFNIWNLDLSYQWRFAPGSQMILLYRNSIFNYDKQSQLSYLESLDNLFGQPARHNLSLRIIYFLDYNEIKNTIKG